MRKTKLQKVGALVLKALREAAKVRDELQDCAEPVGDDEAYNPQYQKAQDMVVKLNDLYGKYRREFE